MNRALKTLLWIFLLIVMPLAVGVLCIKYVSFTLGCVLIGIGVAIAILLLLAIIKYRRHKREDDGISLDESVVWSLDLNKRRDFPEFLKALQYLFPDGGTLCLEATHVAPDVEQYLRSNAASNITRIAGGTIWPRSEQFHLPLEPRVLNELADLAEKHAMPEIVDHLHVYKDGEVLLHGYDFFGQEASLSEKVQEENIKKFCEIFKCKYKRESPEGGK